MAGQIQQGDVCFERIERIPKSAQRVQTSAERIVVAEGEATGHAHAIEDVEAAELFEKDGVLYLDVKESATVVHEEHGPLTLDPGAWEVGIVNEVDPFSEEIRKVVD